MQTVASKHRGFTLIELLVVMLIVSVMAATVALSVGGGYSNAEKEGFAKQIFRQMRYAQEEAILSSRVMALSISDEFDFEENDEDKAEFFNLTWLALVIEPTLAPSASNSTNKTEEDEERPLSAQDVQVVQSKIPERRFLPITDSALEDGVQLPKVFELTLERDGQLIDLAQLDEEAGNLFEFKREKDDKDDKDEEKENTKQFIPVIYFFPDGSVSDFRLELLDSEDTDQGFVIKSKQGADIVWSSLIEEVLD